MLERYVEDLDAKEFIRSYQRKHNISHSKAVAELRRKIPDEAYYQGKIKKALKSRYKGAFIRKIAQGAYSEAGIPDILFIYDGHYFGFEIKRPVLGSATKLQERTIEEIRNAGGTAACISWPEEAIRIIENWRRISGDLPWI